MFDSDKFLTDILNAIETKNTTPAAVCQLLGMNPAAINSLKKAQVPSAPVFLKFVQWAQLNALDYLVDPQDTDSLRCPKQYAKAQARLYITQVLKVGVSRGINAYGVANETGIKPATLSRMQSHGTCPTEQTLTKLAKWSGLDPAHFFTTPGAHA